MFWIDVETTGLDPQAGQLLEVGIVITDRWGEVQDYDNWIIRPRSRTALVYMEEFVRDMHTTSGLLKECEEPYALYPDEAESLIAEWLVMRDVGPSQYPLCGSSVPFDRAWAREHMPLVERAFHYRDINISSFFELMRIHAPEVHESRPEKREIHRVLPDLADTLEGYKYILTHFADADWYAEDAPRILRFPDKPELQSKAATHVQTPTQDKA
jgi:oligoribonuclease